MLPMELTNRPVSEVLVLRRLAARNDPDIQIALNLLSQSMADLRMLQEEPQVEIEEEPAWKKPGRKCFGEREGELHVVAKILSLREANKSLREIAKKLNAAKHPTASGKKWHPQTVSNVIKRWEAEFKSTRGRS